MIWGFCGCFHVASPDSYRWLVPIPIRIILEKPREKQPKMVIIWFSKEPVIAKGVQ
jgi:hypothetical protein